MLNSRTGGGVVKAPGENRRKIWALAHGIGDGAWERKELRRNDL